MRGPLTPIRSGTRPRRWERQAHVPIGRPFAILRQGLAVEEAAQRDHRLAQGFDLRPRREPHLLEPCGDAEPDPDDRAVAMQRCDRRELHRQEGRVAHHRGHDAVPDAQGRRVLESRDGRCDAAPVPCVLGQPHRGEPEALDERGEARDVLGRDARRKDDADLGADSRAVHDHMMVWPPSTTYDAPTT